jgi:hypothetical protein
MSNKLPKFPISPIKNYSDEVKHPKNVALVSFKHFIVLGHARIFFERCQKMGFLDLYSGDLNI